MYRGIKVDDITVPMIANGATPLRYRHLFGKDLIAEFQDAEDNAAKVADCIPELAFIMAKAAEAKDGTADLNKLSQEDFITWLEQFSPMGLALAAEYIVDLYMGNAKTSVDSKKKETTNR